MATQAAQTPLQTQSMVKEILTSVIDRDREREIIIRRYGLYDRKETLEQIGELLGITRERVRQLEKSVMARLKAVAEQGSIPHIADVQVRILAELNANGGVMCISELTKL